MNERGANYKRALILLSGLSKTKTGKNGLEGGLEGVVIYRA